MPIVEATVAFVSTDKDLAKKIEAAMATAAMKARAGGVTDPERIRKAMLAARDQVKGRA